MIVICITTLSSVGILHGVAYALGCESAPSEHCGMSILPEQQSLEFQQFQTHFYMDFSVLRFHELQLQAFDYKPVWFLWFAVTVLLPMTLDG